MPLPAEERADAGEGDDLRGVQGAVEGVEGGRGEAQWWGEQQQDQPAIFEYWGKQSIFWLDPARLDNLLDISFPFTKKNDAEINSTEFKIQKGRLSFNNATNSCHYWEENIFWLKTSKMGIDGCGRSWNTGTRGWSLALMIWGKRGGWCSSRWPIDFFHPSLGNWQTI